MPVRSGDEFLASIRDDREVWMDGERVEDVTVDPRFKPCADVLAEVYDLQHDPAYHDLLTMESPTTGDRVSRGYALPQSVEELVRRREMIELLMRRSAGALGRLPEYMASIVAGLYDVRKVLAEADPAFADNAEAYLEYCREHDWALTHSFADPPRDGRLPRQDFENLRLVEQRSDGIIVRGVKSVATLAPYANEYLALAPNRPGLDPSEIVYFAVPVNTKGLRLYCRPALTRANPADHRLSANFDEMDAWVVFDDVFVPRDRVFYLQQAETHQDLLSQILCWAFYHILIRMACKAEVLAGVCSALTDYLGKGQQHPFQMALCDLYGYVETLRAFLHAAEAESTLSESGFVVPNPTQVTLGRIHAVEHHPAILQTVREVAGSGILMAPGELEMRHPDIRSDVDKYLVGPDERAPERFKLLKLAWELSCESFGSRQLLFEMHNAGAHLVTKQKLVRNYDAQRFEALAKSLAGITAEGPAGPPLGSVRSLGTAGRGA